MKNFSWIIAAQAAIMMVTDLSVRFEKRSESAGFRFSLVSGSPAKNYIPESMSGGLGFIDFDADGFLDIFFVNGSTIERERTGSAGPGNRLYRNNGNGTFTDVTERAGVGGRGWGMGVSVADVNGDGYDDLYLTQLGPNILYLNNRDGTFRDFSKESGTDDPSWSSSAAFGDYDGDGDLDLYVSNYLEFDFHNPPADNPLCRYRGVKVQCGPRGLIPSPDRFYENIGGGRFIDATQKSGVGNVRPYYGMGVVWADYDNDGDQDIYVANDSTPNYLFRNNGNNSFSEVALTAGVALSDDGKEQAGMGVDFGDYDNDGDLDLVVTNFSEDYNTLYRNEGNGHFSDVSYAAGIGEPTWQYLAWGVQFVDFDLDGFLDLAIANGHVYPEVDRMQTGTRYRQLNQFFRNSRNGKFQDATAAAGPGFEEVRSSRGLAAGDIDNDGRIDLLIANLDEGPSLLMNGSPPSNWLLVKLEGTRSNRNGFGARVQIRSGSLRQLREIKSGGSYQSQSDLRAHFGLGSADVIDELEVRWPGGKVETLQKVPANQILRLREKD